MEAYLEELKPAYSMPSKRYSGPPVGSSCSQTTSKWLAGVYTATTISSLGAMHTFRNACLSCGIIQPSWFGRSWPVPARAASSSAVFRTERRFRRNEQGGPKACGVDILQTLAFKPLHGTVSCSAVGSPNNSLMCSSANVSGAQQEPRAITGRHVAMASTGTMPKSFPLGKIDAILTTLHNLKCPSNSTSNWKR